MIDEWHGLSSEFVLHRRLHYAYQYRHSYKANMTDFDAYNIGEQNELIQLGNCEENQLVAACLAQKCRRLLDIVSRQLDPPIFNAPEFVEAVRQLIIKNRRPQVRIIVFDPAAIVRHGHQLLELAHRHSSCIEMRKASAEFNGYNECLLVADETAYLHRNNSARYEATVNFNDRRQSRFYLDDFATMWEAASPDHNLRQMNL